MYHYELHREIAAERLRQAEHERLVRRARETARAAGSRGRGHRSGGPVTEGPTADRFDTAA